MQINKNAARPQDNGPVLVIYCKTILENGDPFSDDYYWQAYQDVMLALHERGITTYLVSSQDTAYAGHGRFKVAYTINNRRRSLHELIRVEDIHADLVFDRTGFKGSGVTVINNRYVQKIGTDKVEMYKHFAKLQPYSIVCYTPQETLRAMEKIGGECLVLKYPVSYGGFDVHFGSKKELYDKLDNRYPVVVQEFVDTSAGIPGLTVGVHDMRLAMCGGELISCFIRQAQPGSLYSNVAQGGTLEYVPLDAVPAEPLMMAHEIDKHFAAYPRYYSADFAHTPNGWKLIEINALIGLEARSDGPGAVHSIEKLADYLAKVCVHAHRRSLVPA